MGPPKLLTSQAPCGGRRRWICHRWAWMGRQRAHYKLHPARHLIGLGTPLEMRAQFQWAGPSLRNGLYCYWCGIGNDSTRTRQYRFPRTHQTPDHHRTKNVGPKYNTTNFDTWRAHAPQTTTVRCSPFLGLLGLDKTWKGSEPGGKSRWLLRIHFKNKLYLGMI